MAKFLKFKLCAKFGKNRLFIVAHHFEAAALRRAVVCESGNDHRPSRLQGPPERVNVSVPASGSRQKIKDCSATVRGVGWIDSSFSKFRGRLKI
jgi:hypothetical protein